MAACNCRDAGTVHRAEQLLPSQRLANCHAVDTDRRAVALPKRTNHSLRAPLRPLELQLSLSQFASCHAAGTAHRAVASSKRTRHRLYSPLRPSSSSYRSAACTLLCRRHCQWSSCAVTAYLPEFMFSAATCVAAIINMAAFELSCC